MYTLQVWMDDQWRDIMSWPDAQIMEKRLAYYLSKWENQAYRIRTPVTVNQ